MNDILLYIALVFLALGVIIVAVAILRRRARKAKVERSRLKTEGVVDTFKPSTTSGHKNSMHSPFSHEGNLYIFVG